jgi:RHS repeat-associated protein
VRSRNDYYAHGMVIDGAYKMNESGDVPKNKNLYNGKEYVNDMALSLLEYGARFSDPAIGRWGQIDQLAEQFPGWNPYHYVHNNPILLTDPTGMKADSTRIYNTNGQYQFTINDNLPNEDHFLNDNKLNDLNSQCCTDTNQEGEYARSISEFYIGADTRNQIQSVTALSDKIGKEKHLY